MAVRLAVNGGEAVRTDPFPEWPVWDEREVDALRDVLESGTWGVNGTRTEAFASAFAEKHGAEHAVPLTSGTTALVVALKAAGVGPGDEVIVPPYTFIATATAVLECNAIPVFADVERDSLCLDPAAVAERITHRTAAVIPVHLAGRPADVAGLEEVCAGRDVAIVEDCAQAHGTWVDGEALGTVGDVGCFSFQSSKNLSSGEGGLILTDDDEIYNRAWSITNVGRVPDGEWYEHPVLGSNHRLTEFQAAILQVQMSRMDEQLERRDRNARRLTEGLADVEGVHPQSEHPDTTQRAHHLYIFQFEPSVLSGTTKAAVLEALREEGIQAASGYKPLYHEELFAEFEQRAPAAAMLAERVPDYQTIHCPETERAAAEAGWLPQRVLLGDGDDVDDVVRAFEKVVADARQLPE